ncbi:polyisoprenoid-binding protein [Niastella koreensis]|uniref:YceI family protein n=2 Tax=Niastella koreensis TaxID=354356 RepID=G8TI12_NIAKG|nr:YceI family protein [Niastella koreensis]AEV99615.1 YceI family protein [Niastella koreensis GR20-10]OQP50203.1 polyisoprenoid-binding protein [Niastella koreensis]
MTLKKLVLILLFLSLNFFLYSQQRYFTRNGTISFAAGSGEDIDGINKTTTSVLDAATGQIEFSVLVKGFEFKRALMQEHFNENYMESDKYPKSVFKGKITNIDKINFQKDGLYPVLVKGVLDMHGLKKDVEANGTFKVTGGTVNSIAEFVVLLSDYNITIPSLVKDKVSKTVTIKVNCNYSPLK